MVYFDNRISGFEFADVVMIEDVHDFATDVFGGGNHWSGIEDSGLKQCFDIYWIQDMDVFYGYGYLHGILDHQPGRL